MRKAFPTEFVFQVFALLIAFILVHALYVTVIRPQADAFLRQQAASLLARPDGLPIGAEDTRGLAARLQSLPRQEREYLLPRALLTAIERFAATRNVQDVSTAARDLCGSEGERLESELSTIRYIAWAIPSVGFIGTVRGIGNALGQAHRAVEGDITGVTENLGVAFNSTFIALVISIVLMFFVHQLQSMQERLVLDTERYVDRGLVRRLKS
jgi:biopolymer transport protein ExbB/TolQ